MAKLNVVYFMKKEGLIQKHFSENLLAVTYVTVVRNRGYKALHILFRKNGTKYFAELNRTGSRRYNLTQVAFLR
jgi:hypothetical protein